MYYTFQELIDKYITGEVFVSVQELEDEGLLQEFCNQVEEIAPSRSGVYTHRELYDFHKWQGVSPRGHYFKMNRSAKGGRYCTLDIVVPRDKIAHLINDVPPVDMECLLNE